MHRTICMYPRNCHCERFKEPRGNLNSSPELRLLRFAPEGQARNDNRGRFRHSCLDRRARFRVVYIPAGDSRESFQRYLY